MAEQTGTRIGSDQGPPRGATRRPAARLSDVARWPGLALGIVLIVLLTGHRSHRRVRGRTSDLAGAECGPGS